MLRSQMSICNSLNRLYLYYICDTGSIRDTVLSV